MTTARRLDLLADCAALFEPFTGPFDGEILRAWLRAELGAAEALEVPVAHGPLHRLARPPRRLLHVVSGNTPHAAFQSLLRGFVLGGENLVKLPAGGLPEFESAAAALPPALRRLVTLTRSLPADWTRTCDTVVVFGSDETISWFAAHTPPPVRLVPHGERLSIALVEGDPTAAAVLAARDVSLHDQQGCLSVHDLYLSATAGLSAPEFAALLAGEMQRFNAHTPRAPLTPSAAGAITTLRETTRFLSANDPEAHGLWESPGTTAWTVIHEDDPTLKVSCLNRVVYVKPWPQQAPAEALGPAARHLSSIALHPFDGTRARDLATLPATRICPLGQTHHPSLFWHHDGLPPLASLVTWVDLG